VADVAGESLIQTPGFLCQQTDFDLHARSAQFFKTCSAHFRIGIRHGRDDPPDTGGDESIGTGRRPSLMGMRLKIDVKGSSACLLTGLLKRQNFRVLYSSVSVDPSSCDLSVRVDNNRTHIRIGRSHADALTRQMERTLQKSFIGGVIGHWHGAKSLSRDFCFSLNPDR